MTETPPPPVPRASVVVRPWLIPLLTGVIGLLLGSLLTLGAVAIVSHATPAKAEPNVAAITAADAKYEQALSDCAIDTSGALTIDAEHGILRLHGGSPDGAVSGLSPDILSCVVNSLGASSAVVDALSGESDVSPGRRTARFTGLQLVWVTADSGDVTAVVTPDVSK